MSPAPPDRVPPTVVSWHVLAEHVLGAGLHAATGHIGLHVVPGGFATPDRAADALGGVWAVTGAELRRTGTDGRSVTAAVTTVADAAAFFGTTAGMPPSVYSPATPLEPHAALPVDLDEAAHLAAWFTLGTQALAVLADHHPALAPGEQTLWPEHFDLGLTMAEVNYGVSPGDEGHPEPYLYVGPWTPRTGPFWNAPFGAALAASAVHSVADAVAFFEEGRARAAGEA